MFIYVTDEHCGQVISKKSLLNLQILYLVTEFYIVTEFCLCRLYCNWYTKMGKSLWQAFITAYKQTFACLKYMRTMLYTCY